MKSVFTLPKRQDVVDKKEKYLNAAYDREACKLLCCHVI